MGWQRPARVVVAIVGIASAIAIYMAIGERAKQTVAPPPQRSDPNSIIESSGNVLQQVRGSRQDFLIEAERQLTYKNGASKWFGVKITVRNRGGRDYVVTGREAQAGENEKDLQLTGGVTLAANDGFIVKTDTATFDQEGGLMTAPGTVTFEKDRMTGSGIGMSYDKNSDVLMLDDRSHVNFRDEHGNTT